MTSPSLVAVGFLKIGSMVMAGIMLDLSRICWNKRCDCILHDAHWIQFSDDFCPFGRHSSKWYGWVDKMR